MRNVYRLVPALMLGLCSPVAALAQTAPACPAVVAPTGALAAWATPTISAPASSAANLASADLPVGQALHLALLPQAEVKFPLQPAKPAADGYHAGLLGLTIAQAGTYRVAVGTGAWIDLVDNGKFVASAEHAHGPACSGIVKMVDFTLHPGAYVLQISASTDAQTTVLVVKVP